MRSRTIAIVSLILIIINLYDCSKSDDENISATNLIHNFSFEFNDVPSLTGWINSDSTVQFIADAPPGGGKWSAKLDVIWGPPFTISTTVKPSEQLRYFKLSVWGKKMNRGGDVALYLKQIDTLILRKAIAITDTNWTLYSLLDTIALDKSDSLVVVLSGGFSNILPGKTFFDPCKLEQLP